MAIVYRTAGAWGAGKGSNLTAAEADGNIWQLVQDILAAAAAAGSPVGIASISADGSSMTVVMTDATEYVITLPRPVQRPTVTTAVAGTTLTPSLAQSSAYFRCSHASGCTVTIPDNDTVAFPIDAELHFCQRGGAINFVEGATDAVINYPVGKMGQSFGLGAVVTLKKVGTDEWDAFGDLADEVTA